MRDTQLHFVFLNIPFVCQNIPACLKLLTVYCSRSIGYCVSLLLSENFVEDEKVFVEGDKVVMGGSSTRGNPALFYGTSL